MTITTLGYAFLGGLLPSLIWLYFLLREDSRCPEPPELIALAFVAGMGAVAPALFLERFARTALENAGLLHVLISWATIEEVLKYAAAALFVLWRSPVDEGPDYVIYLLTVALGFAAAENMLFLLVPLEHGSLSSSVFTGDLRFLGSTLLHVIASSAIGFSLAFSSQFSPVVRTAAAAAGLILAIALHTAFNALIMNTGGTSALLAFFLVWAVAVIFFAAFEVLKYFRYRNMPANTC